MSFAAKAVSSIAPIAGKVIGALPIVGDIARGIGSIFSGKRNDDNQSYGPSPMSEFGANIHSGMSNMFNTGHGMINAGRGMFNGMRESFRTGDISGAMNHFADGLNNMAMGTQRLTDQGNEVMAHGRGMFNSARNMFRSLNNSRRMY